MREHFWEKWNALREWRRLAHCAGSLNQKTKQKQIPRTHRHKRTHTQTHTQTHAQCDAHERQGQRRTHGLEENVLHAKLQSERRTVRLFSHNATEEIDTN